MDMSRTANHIPPRRGGDPQGRSESNRNLTRFGGGFPNRWVVPMFTWVTGAANKNRLRGFPLGRSPSAPPRGYVATTPVLGWLSSRSMAAPDSEHGFSYPWRVALVCQNVMSPW